MNLEPTAADAYEEFDRFLECFWEDQRNGCERPLSEYVARHAAAAELVAAEYLGIRREDASRLGYAARYERGEPIGHGGQARVFLAKDKLLGRPVALKIIELDSANDSHREPALKKEAHVMSALKGPGFCPIYDVGTGEDHAYIAMQYVDGTTIDVYVRGLVVGQPPQAGAAEAPTVDAPLRDRATIDVVARLIEQCASSLHSVHLLDVTHRDIKPGNIMVDRSGNPVLLDFGMALVADPAAGPGRRERVGTEPYMAPEQLRDDRGPVDARTDVYGLGLVLWELLVGRRAFPLPKSGEPSSWRALQEASIVAGGLMDLREANPSVPRDLAAIVRKAIAPAQNERYPTARDFARDLDRFLERRPVEAAAHARLNHLVLFLRRNGLVSALVALFLIVAGVGIAKIAQSRAEVEEKRLRIADLNDAAAVASLRHRAANLSQDVSHRAGLERWLADAHRLLEREGRHREQRSRLARSGRPRSGDLRRPEIVVLIDDLAARAQQMSDAIESSPDHRGVPRLVAEREQLRTEMVRLASEEEARVEHDRYDFHEPSDELVYREARSILEGTAWVRAEAPRIAAALAGVESSSRAAAEEHRQLWAKIAGEVAVRYGQRLMPQIGLYPLGPDRESGLQEFLHLATHTGPLPERNPLTGQMRMTGQMGLVFVLVPGGTSWIGAQNRDPDGRNYDPFAERLAGPVETTLDWFLISKFEMTQGQWVRFAGSNPSNNGGSSDGRDTMTYPVESVSWNEVVKLRNVGLDLPTEAQWEYAARGGTTTMWHFGDREDLEDLDLYANFADDAAAEMGAPWPTLLNRVDGNDDWPYCAPVDTQEPNPLGLHYVHGNVAEWTRDLYGSYYYPMEKGTGRFRGSLAHTRMVRGGSFLDDALRLRSVHRVNHAPEFGAYWLGVRPIRTVGP